MTEHLNWTDVLMVSTLCYPTEFRLPSMVSNKKSTNNLWKIVLHKLFFPSFLKIFYFVFQFSSVAQSCPTLCDPMNCSTPGLPVHHQLPEFTQTHIHRVSDAIQPSHPLSSPSWQFVFENVNLIEHILLELLSILMYSFISFVKFGKFSAFFVVVQVFLLSLLL